MHFELARPRFGVANYEFLRTRCAARSSCTENSYLLIFLNGHCRCFDFAPNWQLPNRVPIYSGPRSAGHAQKEQPVSDATCHLRHTVNLSRTKTCTVTSTASWASHRVASRSVTHHGVVVYCCGPDTTARLIQPICTSENQSTANVVGLVVERNLHREPELMSERNHSMKNYHGRKQQRTGATHTRRHKH